MHFLRHPRVLLGGDLHKRLFKLSQWYWEIPDKAFGLSGIRKNVSFLLLNPHAGLGTFVRLQNVQVFTTRAGG